MTMRRLSRCAAPPAAALALAVGVGTPPAAADVTAAGELRLVSIGSFDKATYVAAPPADTRRVFVVEQGGTIKVVRDGTLLPSPFMTVPSVNNNGEQGLLSMAFAPDYATSGRFYVYFNDHTACDVTGQNCDIRIDEFRRAAGDEDRGDLATRRTVLSISHREFDSHNGGQLQFGADGLLYVSTGDGGGLNDALVNSQDTSKLLGKVLRIDPRESGGNAYTVPSDNPYYGPTPGADEVWAYGLRNPWRFSFDRLTNDLAIADVGQGNWEEVDFQLHGQGAGANYGWPVFEGNQPFLGATPPPNYVPPVLAYDHSNGNCSITGGYVSRDRAVTRLVGRYVYGDYCKGELRSAILAPGGAREDTAVGDPANPAAPPLAVTLNSLSSFGEDALCRIYVATQAGPVYRIESASPGAAPGCVQAQPAPGPLPVSVPVPPVFSFVSMSRTRFAVARGPTALSGVRRGSAFRYTLSEVATVQIKIQRKLPGRRVGRKCRAPSRRNRSRPRCRRFFAAGTLRRRAKAGANRTWFTGRLGSRALAAGGYRAVLGATDADGNPARTRTLNFTVVTG
jgi:glucose/arabinose dehydrogenase